MSMAAKQGVPPSTVLAQQDQPGTGPEYRQSLGHPHPQGFKKVQIPQKLPHYGAFSAGKNQRVKGAVQVLGAADLKVICAQPVQCGGVFGEGPLEGQNGDNHFICPAPP